VRTPRRRLLALAAVAGAALTLLAPTAAFAAYSGDETNYTAVSSGPAGVEGSDGYGDYNCIYSTGVKACFMPAGDKLYVRDVTADGYTAVLQWSTNGRTGSCVNNLGAGNWGLCDKDFTEDKLIHISAARYKSGNYVDGSPGSIWLYT